MDPAPGQGHETAQEVAAPPLPGSTMVPAPLGTRRTRRWRRPTGEPPPLPRHLETTGVGWLMAAVGLMAVSMLVFAGGRYGHGLSLTVVDDRLLVAWQW
jgi:hypothetical protein